MGRRLGIAALVALAALAFLLTKFTRQTIVIHNGTRRTLKHVEVSIRFGRGEIDTLAPGRQRAMSFRDAGNGTCMVKVEGAVIGNCEYVAGFPMGEEFHYIEIRGPHDLYCERL